jgi:hypothetical protein
MIEVQILALMMKECTHGFLFFSLFSFFLRRTYKSVFSSTFILTLYCLGHFLGVLSGDFLGSSVGRPQMPRETMATLP